MPAHVQTENFFYSSRKKDSVTLCERHIPPPCYLCRPQRLHGLWPCLAPHSISGLNPLTSLSTSRPVGEGRDRKKKNQKTKQNKTGKRVFQWRARTFHRGVNSEPSELPVDSKRGWGTGLDADQGAWPSRRAVITSTKQNLCTTEQALKCMVCLGPMWMSFPLGVFLTHRRF